MSQLKERLETFSQKEKDESKEKDRKQRIQGLIAKYGRKKVEAAKKNAREDGDKNITYQELKRRIDNAKGRLKKGEVKKWDKEKQRWVSNKEEDVNEDAPPTAKHERMVKHIKKSYKKDGKLTKDEKSIAYATAWKDYNKDKLA